MEETEREEGMRQRGRVGVTEREGGGDRGGKRRQRGRDGETEAGGGRKEGISIN